MSAGATLFFRLYICSLIQSAGKAE
jgi:hypothetical protein